MGCKPYDKLTMLLRSFHPLEEVGQSGSEQDQCLQESTQRLAQVWKAASGQSGCYSNHHSVEETETPCQRNLLAHHQNERYDFNLDVMEFSGVAGWTYPWRCTRLETNVLSVLEQLPRGRPLTPHIPTQLRLSDFNSFCSLWGWGAGPPVPRLHGSVVASRHPSPWHVRNQWERAPWIIYLKHMNLFKMIWATLCGISAWACFL